MPPGPDLDPIPNTPQRRVVFVNNEQRGAQARIEGGETATVDNAISEKKMLGEHIWTQGRSRIIG